MAKINSQAPQLIEELTGTFTVPVHIAARILGLSLRAAKAELPIVDRGYRSKEVSIAAMKEYLANHTAPRKTA